MHILQLVPQLSLGGVERGVLDVSKGLIARGHRVSVVSAGGPLVEPLIRLGAMHHTLPIHRKTPWTIWQQVPALVDLIRSTNVDLIHARSRAPAWAAYLAARRTGVPFVTTCHGFYSPHPFSKVMAWGQRVIVPSNALGRYAIDRLGAGPSCVRVVPRGVDLEAFPFHQPPAERAPGPWRIGVIGRLTAIKGHEVAIRALHQLKQQRVDARLCVVGALPNDKPAIGQTLQRLAASLGVQDTVEWLGQRDDVAAAIASMDVVLVPSVYPESFGRSVIEAQAVGRPVVASKVGALAEIVEHERTGLLVEPGRAADAAAAIARLIGDADLRARLVRQARARVEQEYALSTMVERELAVYDEVIAKPKVLVWKLSAVGDAVLIGPSLRAIRKQFPSSSITLAVGQPLYDLMVRCPYVDELFVYRPGMRRLVPRIRSEGFSISIDLQNSRTTHWLAWAAGIPIRIGYARKWGRLLNRPVPLPKDKMGPVAHQQHLLRASSIRPDGDQLEVWPSEEHERAADALLASLGVESSKPLVGLHPGASARWKTKRWEPGRWSALCDRLAGLGAQVVITGTDADRALIDELAAAAQHTPFVAAGRTTLLELACLIRRCQVFVATDSAPLHLAAAVGTPAVALFGPTDPVRHVPPARQLAVLQHEVFCGPCYSPTCRTITHACMAKITVDEVYRATSEMLSLHTVHRTP